MTLPDLPSRRSKDARGALVAFTLPVIPTGLDPTGLDPTRRISIPGLADADAWAMLGATPMIGQNVNSQNYLFADIFKTAQ